MINNFILIMHVREHVMFLWVSRQYGFNFNRGRSRPRHLVSVFIHFDLIFYLIIRDNIILYGFLVNFDLIFCRGHTKERHFMWIFGQY